MHEGSGADGRAGPSPAPSPSPPPGTRFRTAPTAARALRILERLAEDPERGYTQAELQRQLGFSHGNLHAILATLEGAGHVRRDPLDRTYTLGPAVLAIGDAARRAYPEVEVALPIMEELAAQLDTECHAATRVGTTLLVVARVGPLLPLGYGVSTGQRLPLAPPIGSSFMSWAGDDEIETYLHSGTGHLASEELDRYRRTLAGIRRRGYSVRQEAEPRQQLSARTAELLREAAADDHGEELAALAAQLAHTGYLTSEPGEVGAGTLLDLSSPVFGADAAVALTVGVSFGPSAAPAMAVAELGEQLLAATRRITRDIGGRPPT